MKSLDVRLIEHSDDFSAIEKLQQHAWGIDAITTVPAHIIQAASRCGFVAGAFFKKEIVGFILALETRDKKIHYSHMMGIDPKWQGGKEGVSVGMLLKAFHKKIALEQGVEAIEWTFDPLLSNNANLNFHKLRTRAIRYEPDAYGETSEVGIYRGMPTDRFLVRWFLKEERPNITKIEDIPKIKSVTHPGEIEGKIFKVSVPFNIQKLKKDDMKEACRVRLQTRDIFLMALSKGYEVEDFIYLKDACKNFYIFVKEKNKRNSHSCRDNCWD